MRKSGKKKSQGSRTAKSSALKKASAKTSGKTTTRTIGSKAISKAKFKQRQPAANITKETIKQSTVIRKAAINSNIKIIKPANDTSLKTPAAPSKYSWTNLPKCLPAHIRFLITSCGIECKNSAMPFAFSKFMNSLPDTICGLEFSVLLLNLEHESPRIAQICSMQAEQIAEILESAKNNFTEHFNVICGDISRKLRTQIKTSSLNLDSLTEQYYVPKVNKDFQTMLVAIILKSLGAENLNYAVNAIAV